MVFWVWLVFGLLVVATVYVFQEAENRRKALRHDRIMAIETADRPLRAADGPVTCLGCQYEFGTLRAWVRHDCTALWWDADELRRASLGSA